MAGSLNHIIDANGKFTMDSIDNLGDAHEALEECYNLIFLLADGDSKKIGAACDKLGYPNPWADEFGDDPKQPMSTDSVSPFPTPPPK